MQKINVQIGEIMAKKTAAEIAVSQADIPERFRAGMRLTDDGATIIVTFSLPRMGEHTLRGGEIFPFDRAKFAGSGAFRENYCYGEKRDIKDGAKCDETVKGVRRIFTDAERTEDAHRNAVQKVAVWYGEREKQAHGGVNAPPVVLAATNILIGNLVKQKLDSDGKRYKRSTLPGFVAKSITLDEVRRAAEQFGVGKKAIESIIAAAEAVSVVIDLD